MRWRPGWPAAPSIPAGYHELESVAAPGVISAGPVYLDLRRRRAFIDGWCVHLPASEVALLMLLMRNAGRVLTTAELALATNSESTDPVRAIRHTLRLMRRLCRRLAVHPLCPVLIERVETVGFRFAIVEAPRMTNAPAAE